MDAEVSNDFVTQEMKQVHSGFRHRLWLSKNEKLHYKSYYNINHKSISIDERSSIHTGKHQKTF
jgi:hypothetical protein